MLEGTTKIRSGGELAGEEKKKKKKEMKEEEEEEEKWMNLRQVLAGADLRGDSATE